LQQKLHYLHEATDSCTESRFVYFCTECLCVLKVSKSLSSVDRVIETLENRCPSCGSTLEGSLSCKLTPVSDEWSDAPSRRERRVRPGTSELFKQASSLLREPFNDFSPVERFEPGRVAVFTGKYAETVAEFLCFRGQLPKRHGGLDTVVVFIDGGNCSDPYLFASYAREYMVPPREALGRVVTSRAFTIYQLANLVTRELPAVIDEHHSKFVIISDILSMFNDPSIDAKEAHRVIEAIRGGLRELKKRGDVFLLVTLTAKTPYDHLITDSADLLLNLSPANSKVAATLLKHPSKQSSLQLEEEKLLRPVLHQRYHRYG
jgi:hypothetical protein